MDVSRIVAGRRGTVFSEASVCYFQGMTFEFTTHIPVMPDEVMQWLAPMPGTIIVDGTAGGGGHLRLIAEKVIPGGKVIAVDRDPEAISRLEQSLKLGGSDPSFSIQLLHGRYDCLDELGIAPASLHGILLDLGLSSDQLADQSRGFSYDSDGDLDLRFDPQTGKPASQLIAELKEPDLANLIYQFGEERLSRRIARRIVEIRRREPIRTARQLAEVVRRCVPRSRGHRIDPATRTFQALRIAVNDELGCLKRAIQELPPFLKPGGRLVVISFHSLEDRIVKHSFREHPDCSVLTKKPLRPSSQEQTNNPRSRSAKLRVAERTALG